MGSYKRTSLILVLVSVVVNGVVESSSSGARNESSFVSSPAAANGLYKGYYWRTCPHAEYIVRSYIWQLLPSNPYLPAKLLRLHAHDCFVRGCDASILLDPAGGEQVEKQAGPNLSVGGFEVIDQIKAMLESSCPGIVSCADIITLATRDAVSYQYGYMLWDVPTGRRDGVVSRACETNQLPSPTASFPQLLQTFAQKGLNVIDLVALSGAHTLGTSHCSFIQDRLYNFNGQGRTDPSLEPNYARYLMQKCPRGQQFGNTVVEMDPWSSSSFDTHYFKAVLENKGFFRSDAALLDNQDSRTVLNWFTNHNVFLAQFGQSMEKLGTHQVLTGNNGQIRKQCRLVNCYSGGGGGDDKLKASA